MRGKNYWMVIAIVIAVIGGIFVYLYFDTVNNQKSVIAECPETDSLALVIDALESQISGKEAEIEEFKLKLDTCENNIQRPLTTEQRLAAAEAELQKLKKKPRVVYVRSSSTKTSVDVPQSNFSSSSFNYAAPSEELSVSSINLANNTTYSGKIEGDFGVTTNSKKNLVYFASNSAGLLGGVYYVNGDPNKKMVLDEKTNYWFYVDPRILSEEEIATKYFTWNMKMSVINWGGGSYQSWFPHESIKSLLNSVRGFEYGKITNDDLNQMSQRDSRIWSPNNPGGIFQPLPDVNNNRSDTNFWHGWNIRTKVTYKKVTK